MYATAGYEVTTECEAKVHNLRGQPPMPKFAAGGALERSHPATCTRTLTEVRMPAFIDISGQRFGRLVATRQAGLNPWGNCLWKCKCDCGNVAELPSGKLRRGHTKSCGCYRPDAAREKFQTHGGTGTRLFTIWANMKMRCRNPNNPNFKNYGGRGIAICLEWQTFEPFRDWALANGYADELSIDRIDNDKGYGQDNCRWADQTTQANNRRPRRKGYTCKRRVQL